jgi:hypothetical protein
MVLRLVLQIYVSPQKAFSRDAFRQPARLSVEVYRRHYFAELWLFARRLSPGPKELHQITQA